VGPLSFGEEQKGEKENILKEKTERKKIYKSITHLIP